MFLKPLRSAAHSPRILRQSHRHRLARPFGAAPPIAALLYALAPELVIGLDMPFAPEIPVPEPLP